MTVSERLASWYHTHKRDLPWRVAPTPYKIWLSEIILQQTRVAQGLPYYNLFIEKYPTVSELAAAPLNEVLKLWQGLGYYTRARNLHETAGKIACENEGNFPANYRELTKLKGIGEYTAAAIASMAFNENVAVIDGNVMRVLSRLFGIYEPVDSAKGKDMCRQRADELLKGQLPQLHNQAMMEFGALVCVPRNPGCTGCVLADCCHAFLNEKTHLLPLKTARGRARDRYFHYFFILDKGFTFLNRRKGKDIWHALYEFPLIEAPEPLPFEKLIHTEEWHGLFQNKCFSIAFGPLEYFHKLTHQNLHCVFYAGELVSNHGTLSQHYLKVSLEDLYNYPVPRVIEHYLADWQRVALPHG
jgi:A/G-specific adenine glycosylase